MKARVFFLFFVSTLFLFFFLTPQSLFASDIPLKLIPATALNWMQENWAYIALAVSEIAAFLPTKIKGIVQAGLTIGSVIFKKKQQKR